MEMVLWNKPIPVEQTSDGGYVVTGNTQSFGAGGNDIVLLKIDEDGNISWQKTYGGNGDDYAYSLNQTAPNGGYSIAGRTNSFGTGSSDVLLLKVGSTGGIYECDIINSSFMYGSDTAVADVPISIAWSSFVHDVYRYGDYSPG